MYRSFFSLLFFFSVSYATAQVACSYAIKSPPQNHQEATLYGIIETQPQLLTKVVNDDDSLSRPSSSGEHLLRFIYSNLRYPTVARDNCITGMVVVSFTIRKDGQIDPASIRCVRDIGAGCGDEGVRLVQLMVDLGFRWTPATQAGKVVPIRFNLPIRFGLR